MDIRLLIRLLVLADFDKASGFLKSEFHRVFILSSSASISFRTNSLRNMISANELNSCS